MTYLNNREIQEKVAYPKCRCFKCRKDIDSDKEEYYIYISRTPTDSEPYCTKCYAQDIENMKELDPFVTPLYARNFIRMNKDV